ncbi:MAG: ABC transporter permease [Deltaproteobacteria bacterium]|nr:ABC transporter permease [Deltaproteobacteria bacterium]
MLKSIDKSVGPFMGSPPGANPSIGNPAPGFRLFSDVVARFCEQLERTREIGLRKAVGASSSAIFRSFLAETACFCIASGLLGAGLGVGLALAIVHGTPPDQRFTSPPEIDPVRIALLVTILVSVGIAAGVIPAWRAARIPPAEALRSQ